MTDVENVPDRVDPHPDNLAPEGEPERETPDSLPKSDDAEGLNEDTPK